MKKGSYAAALLLFAAACQSDRPNIVEPGEAATGSRYGIASVPLVRRDRIQGGQLGLVSGKKVLLYHSDDEAAPTSLRNDLVATGQFAASDISDLAMTDTPVALTTLNTFDCVIVWTDAAPPNPVGQGDRLKEYVDAGGGVLLMTYGYSAED